MNAVSPPPAGWYPDPSGRAPFRYWDGIRWTEHTDQGTAPSPSLTSPNPPPPPGTYAAAAPTYAPAPPTAAGYAHGGYAPAAPSPASAGANWNAQTFVADLKKFDGFALVVVGALLFFAFTFMTWSSGKVTGIDGSISASSNAWNGENVWLIRGWEVTDANVASWLQSATPDAGTDMVVFLPLALIAAGVAVATRTGMRINKATEIVLGASGLLALLLVAEMVHLNGAIDDIKSTVAKAGLIGEGGVGAGLYLALAASLVMAGGALRTFLAGKQAKV